MDYKKILWISHSAISSYEKCPHLYYLEYEYRNPETNNRIQIVNPYLALGSAVHETIEELLDVPIKRRTKVSLEERFSDIFEKYRGFNGGFISKKKEEDFFARGLKMVKRVQDSDFLSRPSTNTTSNFPNMNLLGESVKLVGSIDWVELLPNGKAHIIDFKTGNAKENNGSLQLPIYTLLAEKNLKEEVEKVSYWYLQNDLEPVEQTVKDTKESLEILKEKAQTIKKAIDASFFPCSYGKKCFACRDYEKIFSGDAELIESGSSRNKDVFCIFKEEDILEKILQEDFLDEREKTIFEMRLTTPMETINKKMRLREESSKKIILEIKEKLKNNLHQKELKVVVNLLKR
jgi:CRISPR/Cas system-associated exonuclease Cas4 (RecB family)